MYHTISKDASLNIRRMRWICTIIIFEWISLPVTDSYVLHIFACGLHCFLTLP